MTLHFGTHRHHDTCLVLPCCKVRPYEQGKQLSSEALYLFEVSRSAKQGKCVRKSDGVECVSPGWVGASLSAMPAKVMKAEDDLEQATSAGTH